VSTYTQIYYHIVFSTKDRVPTLVAAQRERLFAYIWGILKNRGCHLYRINGTEDHLHLLTSLHPTVCLADLVKEIKTKHQQVVQGKRPLPGVHSLAGRLWGLHGRPCRQGAGGRIHQKPAGASPEGLVPGRVEGMPDSCGG
jgi:REP element-mobilizing transposase RayT